MSFKHLVRLLTTVLVAASCVSCGSETLVTKVDPNKPGSQASDGVLFSLPETVVSVDVPLTRTAYKPAVYSHWTPFFYPSLANDEYVTEEGLAFKVGAPTFASHGQTDPKHVYLAHIKAKQFETKTLLLEFNEDGIIARTEASSKDDTIDVITSGIKTVATIAAPLIGAGATDLRSNAAFETANMRVASDCGQKLALARRAAEKAEDASARANALGTRSSIRAAEVALDAADKAETDAAVCNEAMFVTQLTPEEAALYQSLDENYKEFLRENFGYQFLTYVAKKPVPPGAQGIEFFFTLNDEQQKFITSEPRAGGPCEVIPAANINCLAASSKASLMKAKAAYDKIQELHKKREDLLLEGSQAQINTSTNLEFRLKEVDAQIKSIEHNFFFGTSAETSATARFQFKPGNGAALELQNLFTYSKSGAKPGICQVEPETPGVFKAVWPRNLKGACHGAGFGIESADLRNSKELIARLRSRAATDPVSIFVYNSLSAATKALITSATDQDKPQVRQHLLKELIAELTSSINASNWYTAPAFAGIEQSGGTIDLRAELAKLQAMPVTPPTQARINAIIPELNRSLLDDAYRDELYRHSAWSGHQITFSVDPSTASMAQTVQNSNLTQHGKRGFPYRVAVPTFARLLDDQIEKGRGAVRIAQYGPVQTLPANLGGRRSSYKITYFDSTGAIRIFDMSADGLIQKQNITDLADAATILRDSESARLKRDTELLDLKRKKLEAEKALKEAQPKASPSAEP